MATFTVTALARTCGLSRTTILYYESIGLLRPTPRSENRYRRYTDADVARLEQIRAHRRMGLGLADIREMLDRPGSRAAAVLERRLVAIDQDIGMLREHRRAILALLGRSDAFQEDEMMTKEKWTAIMKASGFSEADMRRWHAQFERTAPDDHQEFLQYLKIPAQEIQDIRNWSRTAVAE